MSERIARSIVYLVQSSVASQQFSAKVGKPVELSFELAKKSWDSGHIALAERQPNPPFEALEHACTKLNDRSVMGRECRAPVILQRITDELVLGNRLRGVLQGKEVRCYFQALERFVFTVAAGAEDLEQSIIWQAQRPYSFVFQHAEIIELSERLPDADALEQGLILAREKPIGSLAYEPRFEYRRVGQGWATYHERLRDLGRRKNQFLQSCLEEGRVLVFDFFDSGSGLIHPDRWRRAPNSWSSHPNVHFVFSKDLPAQWFNKGTGPRSRERLTAIKEARLHLEELYGHRVQNGGVGKKGDIVQLLIDRFGLSKKAATQVWKEADISEWKRPGRKSDARSR